MLWDRLQALADYLKSGFEAITGAILLSIPFWDQLIVGLTHGVQLMTAICGLIIGLHGVRGIWRRYRNAQGGSP